jgi:hypothetical protein
MIRDVGGPAVAFGPKGDSLEVGGEAAVEPRKVVLLGVLHLERGVSHQQVARCLNQPQCTDVRHTDGVLSSGKGSLLNRPLLTLAI